MIVIMDQGCGFCWQNLVRNEPAPAEAAVEPNGHGIAIAREVSFDRLRFNHQRQSRDGLRLHRKPGRVGGVRAGFWPYHLLASVQDMPRHRRY